MAAGIAVAMARIDRAARMLIVSFPYVFVSITCISDSLCCVNS